MRALTALTAALLVTGGVTVIAADAQAQAPRSLNLSRDERDAIVALQAAASGMDRAAQDAALAAARTRAQGVSARYAIGHYQFEIGRQRNDNAMQSQAAEAMIDSGLATPEEAPGLVAYLAGRSLASGRDASRTDRLIARLVELQPTNSAALVDYGQYTASQLASARGPAGERGYMEFAAALADARLIGEARAVIDEGLRANMVETARIAPALATRIAPAAVTRDRATLPGLRTRAQSGSGAAARAAADNFYAYGQYADAATLYGLALQKGGEDPNLVNLRLGAALA